MCYDTKRSNSLRELDFWKNEATRLAPEATLFLVGTHADVDEPGKVRLESAVAQAKEWRATHVLTSSKSGLGSSILLTGIVETSIQQR